MNLNVVFDNIKNKCFISNYKFIDFLGGEYINNTTKLIIECPKHGIWKTTTYGHFLNGGGCINCSCGLKVSTEIKEWLNTLNVYYIVNDRNVLNGKELDFYFPEKNFAIEYNGERWHSYNILYKRYLRIKDINLYTQNFLKKYSYFIIIF